MSALPSMGNSGLSVRGEDRSPFFAPSGAGAPFSALVRTSRLSGQHRQRGMMLV